MKMISTRKTLLLVMASTLIMPSSLWAEESQNSLNLPAVSVYLTKDVSANGLKKLYRKLAPAFAGKPYIHEYAADSFLINGDDRIVVYDDKSPNAISPDLPREFVQTLGTDSNLRYRASTNKNSLVAQWHDFRFWQCLCYDDTLATDERCQAEPWYPSNECRSALKSLRRYQQNLTDPRLVVVLSKFKPQRGAALENMLSGNSIIRFEGSPYHSIFPVAEFWARRISNPDKQTLFITVLTDVEDENEEKHEVGIIGSTSFIAVQKAAFELAHKINPATKWEYPEDDSLQTSNEQRGSYLLSALIASMIPEGKKKETRRKSTVIRLIRERNNEYYKIVSLDK